jgi:hypothetical protein
VELIRFALTFPTDYWPRLALTWLEQGVPATDLVDELSVFERERQSSKANVTSHGGYGSRRKPERTLMCQRRLKIAFPTVES